LHTKKNTKLAQPIIKERNSKARRSYNNKAQRSFTCKNNKGAAQSKIGK
jgi:hypothetical protein